MLPLRLKAAGVPATDLLYDELTIEETRLGAYKTQCVSRYAEVTTLCSSHWQHARQHVSLHEVGWSGSK